MQGSWRPTMDSFSSVPRLRDTLSCSRAMDGVEMCIRDSYQGVQYAIYPSIIFMGIGAMTDFGPLLANPISLLLGAAAQLGIFTAFLLAVLCLGFTPAQAAAIGVIGGADGPTAILTSSKLAVELLPAIAIAAYSYMALIPMIQPPLMKLSLIHI